MNIEDCEECNTLKWKDICPWYHEDLDCPCSKCLVKMMCSFSCILSIKYGNELQRREDHANQ